MSEIFCQQKISDFLSEKLNCQKIFTEKYLNCSDVSNYLSEFFADISAIFSVTEKICDKNKKFSIAAKNRWTLENFCAIMKLRTVREMKTTVTKVVTEKKNGEEK